MNFPAHFALSSLLGIAIWLIFLLVGLLLAYLVIRFGVFHGLRAHTRWIDEGKDRRRDTHEPYNS
ncbi:hypothetical protein DXT68_08695 [Microbacterium foliorum]|uniref:Uncharacterized protein n=1 Tax=Microbacterium foliorum TaxID=104336 RepID=A0A0F0K9B0_9MICO|nr:hypothetical protein [Microbacterium foliorum]AXL12207.1 hypothetical protein DXT68_08695 [Microbacterium foliorum]KJL17607.1 hypothetical protein RN50_02704 [Microbacterium foliorum]